MCVHSFVSKGGDLLLRQVRALWQVLSSDLSAGFSGWFQDLAVKDRRFTMCGRVCEKKCGDLSFFQCVTMEQDASSDMFKTLACWCLSSLGQDYSAFGDGQGLQGPTVPFLLIFAKPILQSLPDIVIHENVLQMPMDILVELLKCFYLSTVSASNMFGPRPLPGVMCFVSSVLSQVITMYPRRWSVPARIAECPWSGPGDT